MFLYCSRPLSRRSTPQQKTDHSAYPVHVRVLVPRAWLRPALSDQIHRWLDTQLGRGEYAQAGADSILGDAVAFLFRSTDHADAFMAAHPELVLADGTTSVTYTSPHQSLWPKRADPRVQPLQSDQGAGGHASPL